MAVYDDQNSNNEEDRLRESLGELYNQSPSTMRQHIKDDENGADDENTTRRRNLRESDEAADKEDSENVANRVGAGYLKAKEQDAAEGSGEPEGRASFYNGARGVNKDRRQALKNTSKRNKMIIAAAGGVLTIGIGLLMSFGNFFAVFKLDHILQNIDAKSFSRFNASFSNRSDKYFKAYLQMRLTEIDNPDGSYKDTLLFKGDKVDTDRPIRDWYRTLRTGSFEKELQNKTGIAFTSIGIVDKDTGAITLRPARITLNGEEIAKLDAASSGLSPDSINKLKAGKLDNITLQELNSLGSKADGIINDTHIFDNSKTARNALKETIKDETRFWNVLKRRHIRKDIMNKTGITSWKFFETTRSKLTDKKIDVQQKILRKILPTNKTGDFLKCILGAGNCVASADPAAPENQYNGRPIGDVVEGDSTPTEEVTDADGNLGQTTDSSGEVVTKTTTEFGADEVADDVTKTIDNVVSNEVADGSEKIVLSPAKKIVADQIQKFVGGNIYTMAWSWAKKIAKIDSNITNGKFSKLIADGRLRQLSAIYATYGIVRDQAKTGQLTADEFGQVMETVNDVGQSEGWINQSNSVASNTVSAEATKVETDVSKTDYCNMSDSEQQANKIHYFCDSPGDSKAAKLEESYKNSVVGKIIGPIADAVRSVENSVENSVLGPVFDAITNLANILNKVLDPVISGILKVTGLEGEISKVMGYAITKVMTFLGAGPIFDGTPNTGAVNFIMAGSAATAEASTRSSGGVASTPKTLTYSNQLAASYEKAQKDSQSLFDRYASTSNPQSIFSTALFSVTSFNISTSLSHLFGWLGAIPKTLGSLANGNAFATTSNFNTATWAGIDTYDIPPACQILDPLSQDYLVSAIGVIDDSQYATNARTIVDSIRPNLNYTNITDSAQFWKIVYDKIGNNDKQQEIAEAIYNCALFDQRVMSGLGYTSGYTKDGGLNSGDDAGTNNASGTTPSAGIPEDLCSGYYTIANAHGGTVPLGSNGWPINATLKTYGETVSSVCGERKKECLSGNMPYSQKGLCEAFKFYKTFYGANYTSSTGLDDNTKTREWYGIEAKGSAEHRPAEWVANWKSGLNPNNLLACTGVTTLSIYYAYDPTYTSQIYKGDRFKRLTSIYDIQPGDYIDNRIPGVIGHSVIAASKYENGRLVVFNATGFGKTAQFSVYSSTQIKEQGWDKAEYLRWNRAAP